MSRYLRLFAAQFLILTSCLSFSYAQGLYDRAPNFKLQDLSGNTFMISTYKDKQVVLLLFWTTWCPYCRKELKVLNGKYADLAKEGIAVLAINVGESAEKVSRFSRDNALTFPVLLDKNEDAAYSYEIMGIPVYILVDKSGQIVFKDSYFPEKEYKNIK